MNNQNAGARLVALSLGVLASVPTLAQQGGAGESAGLEEIVVTAQRREENLQTVPLAVTALTGDVLARNDIRDLSRVEVLTPGFSFGKSGSDARPAIRGVRTENVAVSGDPTIGFFVDNVYRSRTTQANEPFVDVARVEVQRGPQGTLYGRNTFGGNIAVAAAAPEESFKAGFDLTAGEFSRLSGTGFVNLPVSDTFQLRFAALREEMDGYVEGIDSRRDIFDRDTQYYRAAARFAPNDAFEAVLRYSYWTEKGTGGAAFGYRVGGAFVNPMTGAFDIQGTPVLLNIGATELDGIPDVAGIDLGRPISSNPLFYPGDTVLEQDLKQGALSLNMSYDFGPVTLRSITGQVDFEVFRNADNDFTAAVRNVDGQEDKLTSFSQELQVASNGEGALEWILGYFYFKEDIDWSVFSSCPSTARSTAGCAFAAGFPETTSNAYFGQASWWAVPGKVRLTGGVRYTQDQKDIVRFSATTDTRQRINSITSTGQDAGPRVHQDHVARERRVPPRERQHAVRERLDRLPLGRLQRWRAHESAAAGCVPARDRQGLRARRQEPLPRRPPAAERIGVPQRLRGPAGPEPVHHQHADRGHDHLDHPQRRPGAQPGHRARARRGADRKPASLAVGDRDGGDLRRLPQCAGAGALQRLL